MKARNLTIATVALTGAVLGLGAVFTDKAQDTVAGYSDGILSGLGLSQVAGERAKVIALCDEMNNVVIPELRRADIESVKASVRYDFRGQARCDIRVDWPSLDWRAYTGAEIDSSTSEDIANFIKGAVHPEQRKKLDNPYLIL